MSNAGAYRQYVNAATSGHTKISILSLTPLTSGGSRDSETQRGTYLVVHEWTGEGVSKFSIEWLWLGDNGVTPVAEKGYMRRILKVYRVSLKA